MSVLRAMVIVFAATASIAAGSAHGQTIVVKGKANPFLANQPNGTTCCDGDRVPAEMPALASNALSGGEVLTFSTSGAVSYHPGDLAPSADGFPDFPFSMTADNGTGISGPLNVYVSGLVGVFTTGAPPTGAAPPQLDSGTTFKKLSPGIAQIFWIGDGRTGTGSGAKQKFIVPAGATSLYLGVVDGTGWFDNPGKLKVKMQVQPKKAAS